MKKLYQNKRYGKKLITKTINFYKIYFAKKKLQSMNASVCFLRSKKVKKGQEEKSRVNKF